MQVTSSSAAYGLVDGYIAPGELPALARLPQLMSGAPLYAPITNAAFQGTAYNEAETAMAADAARAQFGVDGSGVTIGVLSDSVDQSPGGLSDSYATGNLDPGHPVQVLADGFPGMTDEGRAMLESIHDVCRVLHRPAAGRQHDPRVLLSCSFRGAPR